MSDLCKVLKLGKGPVVILMLEELCYDVKLVRLVSDEDLCIFQNVTLDLETPGVIHLEYTLIVFGKLSLFFISHHLAQAFVISRILIFKR